MQWGLIVYGCLMGLTYLVSKLFRLVSFPNQDKGYLVLNAQLPTALRSIALTKSCAK